MRSPNGTARRSRATPAPAGTAGAGPAEPASARATSHISVPAASEPASSATTPPPAASTPTVIADESTEPVRSEEHTSELQSPYDLVCRPLPEKKKYNKIP